MAVQSTPEELNLIKFPRTRHLFDAGGSGVSRDDLLMDPGEENRFYTKTTPRGRGQQLPQQLVALEEKVDGANLGISVGKDMKLWVQNRSHFVNSKTHRQFSCLDTWLEENSAGLYQILSSGNLVLYGEWLYAKHSIHYTSLPGYFMAFDLFDKQVGKFLSRRERNRLCEEVGIPVVRLVAETIISGRKDILKWLETKSAFYDGPVEGLYFRIDEDTPTNPTQPQAPPTQPQAPPTQERSSAYAYNLHRAKVVRPDFLQGIEEQWTRQQLTKNIVMYNYDY